MKTNHKTTGENARTTRDRAGRFDHRMTGRSFDAVAYAAALEVLG